MSEGFLGRWSRRKLDAKEGRPLDAAPPPEQPPPAALAPLSEPVPEPTPVAEPPPTLEDTHALTPASDFRRFVQPDVAPPVRNAALKKLFADPRFNVQDGLDVYIDDYSKPDPLPESMLRQMASARFLGLFRDEDEAQAKEDATGPGPSDSTEESADRTVAQSDQVPQSDLPAVPAAPAAPAADAHPDLRLQQDDAAPGRPPGHGAG
jgi:hypothetical protein